MNKNDSKVIHENFHTSTTVQKKVVDERNFTYRHIIQKINLYLNPNYKILDVGCGSGTLSFYYAQKKYKVTGIDISRKAIDTCKLSSKSLGLDKYTEFKTIDFPNELPNGKYDFIILTEVLEHLLDDDLALKKIFSMLNKKGFVLITTPSSNAPLYKMGLADKFDKRVGHLRRYTIDELSKKCKKNGFRIISIEKKEGILRNFLFINPIAGNFIRVINKFNLSNIVTFLDDSFIPIFGESDIFIVAQKP